MRTLKKTLCLVLALVMVLGLCAFNVSAAEFTDSASITYKEAVGVMQAAGVLAGFTDGSFRPDGTLTRAQAARMIACMMGFGDLKGTSSFADCKGHWAESAIAFCAQEGIIAGYGDGNFGPDDDLTGSAWAKMVICALGYNAAAEGIGGSSWEIAVAKKVKSLGLAVNVADFDGTKKITREQACELGFQGMQKPTVEYTPGITVNGVEIPGSYKSTTGDSLLTAMNIKKAANAGSDAFGRPAATKWEKTVAGKTETVYTAAMTPIATVDGSQLTNDFIRKATYLTGTTINAQKNGATADPATDLTAVGAGAQVEFYSTDAENPKTANLAIITEYKLATIVSVNAKNGTIKLKVGNAASGTDYPAPAEGAEDTNNYAALKAFAKDDVLAVCMNGAKVMSAVKANAVVGKVTAASTVATTLADVTVSGTKYAVAATHVNVDANKALGLGSEGTLYLSPNGKVIGFAGKAAESTDTYAFVVKAYAVAEGTAYGSSTKYFVQAVDMNGQEVSYPVTATEAAKYAVAKNELMKVSADPDTTNNVGMYVFDTAAAIETITDAIAATDKRIEKGGKYNYFTSDVQFVYVSGELGTLKISVKSGVQAVKEEKAAGTKINKFFVAKDVVGSTTNKTVSVVFVADAYETPVVTTSDVAFVSSDSVSGAAAFVTDKDGKTVTGYGKKVYIDGEEANIYVAQGQNAGTLNGFYTVSKNGDITVLTPATANNLVLATTVTGVFGNWLSYTGKTDVSVASDVNIVNIAEIEDLTLAGLTGCTVSLVLSADAKTITTIYVTAAPAA